MRSIEFSIMAFLMAAGLVAVTGQSSGPNTITTLTTAIQPDPLDSYLDLRKFGAYAKYSSTTASTTAGSAALTCRLGSRLRPALMRVVTRRPLRLRAARPPTDTGLLPRTHIEAGRHQQKSLSPDQRRRPSGCRAQTFGH
jgi:hypothetical protein